MADAKLNAISTQVAGAPVDLAVRLYRRPLWIWFVTVPIVVLAIASQNFVLTLVAGAVAGAVAELATPKAVLARADGELVVLRASAFFGRPAEMAEHVDPADLVTTGSNRSGMQITVRGAPWTVPKRWIPDYRTLTR